MAINPLIALQTQTIDTATPTRNLVAFAQQERQNQQQERILDLQEGQAQREIDKDLEESLLIGGAVLNDFLEAGDVEGARTFLKNRGKNLIDINKNPEDTFEALELLNQDPEQLQQIAGGLKQEALRRGLIEQTDEGGFTLSRGQARFDAEGNEIASRSNLLSDEEVAQKRELAEAGASKTEVNVGDGTLTPGQKKTDETFATKVVNPFFLKGGSADAQKNLDQLRSARDALEKSDNLTGPIVGSVPDFVSVFANPEAVNVREGVEEVVQRNLRETLGAQFTEKEGERLISRAFNPRLSEEENIERLDRLIKAVENGQKAKIEAIEYFQEHGTLKGFKGSLPSIGSIEQQAFGNPQGGEIDFSELPQ